MKLTINHTRKDLIEGRISGLGFGFIRKVDNESFVTASPISTCKDYLNDVVFVEKMNIQSIGRIYGFDYQNSKLFESGEVYLGCTVYNNTEYKKLFDQNYSYIEKFVNSVTKKYLNADPISISKINSNFYSIQLPLLFVVNPYYISFITYLIRVSVTYSGQEMSEMDYFTIRMNEKIEQNDAFALKQFVKLLPVLEKDPLNLDIYDFNKKRLDKISWNNGQIHNHALMYHIVSTIK